MKGYISNPARLKFNPLESKDPEIRKIFNDDLAKTFWIGIKQKHIVDQYFNEQCLEISNKIKKIGIPRSSSELKEIIDENFKSNYELDFAEEIYPYINGSSKLEYLSV